MKRQTAKKVECKRRKMSNERMTAEECAKTARADGAVRDARGKFAPGNHAGKRFGEGQPTDRGGRPPETFRSIALRLAEQIPEGYGITAREMAVKAQYTKAITHGDTRAFVALVELCEGKNVNVNVNDGVTRIEYVNDWRERR